MTYPHLYGLLELEITVYVLDRLEETMNTDFWVVHLSCSCQHIDFFCSYLPEMQPCLRYLLEMKSGWRYLLEMLPGFMY